MKFGMLVMNQYLPGESMAEKLKESALSRWRRVATQDSIW